jgi:hypothetical protein
LIKKQILRLRRGVLGRAVFKGAQAAMDKGRDQRVARFFSCVDAQT